MVKILGYLFVIKQLSDVFAIMAFDKLKASKEDLDTAGQCEAMGPLFNNCIENLHLSDDYSNLILRNFTGQVFPEEFMSYLDQLRSMKPKKDSFNDWVAKHYSKKISYNQQQKQNLYFGHYLLTRATQLTSTIRNLALQSTLGSCPHPLWKECYRHGSRNQDASLQDSSLQVAYRRVQKEGRDQDCSG